VQLNLFSQEPPKNEIKNEEEQKSINRKTTWAERQEKYTGKNPLFCNNCKCPMILKKIVFGRWEDIEFLFNKAGLTIPPGYKKLKPLMVRAP
jgi:hypothetical protein